MSISANLKTMRLESGLTQEEAASMIGVSRQCLSSYETGRTSPDIDTLTVLANIYHADVSDIIYGKSDRLKPYSVVKRLKWALSAFLWISTILYSVADRLLRDYFFIPAGDVTEDVYNLIKINKRLVSLRDSVSFASLVITAIILIFLLSYCCIKNKRAEFKSRVLWTLITSFFVMGTAFLIGIGDPRFHVRCYLEIPQIAVGLLIIFLVVDLLIEYFQNKGFFQKRE